MLSTSSLLTRMTTAMERLTKLKKQQSPRYLRKHWDEMTPLEQSTCCTFQNLPLDLISERWWEMSPKLQIVCCRHQRLPESLIEVAWEKMPEDARTFCCEYQKLSPPFLEQHWNRMTDTQRTVICIYQELTTAFVEQYWDTMSSVQRMQVVKIATPEFLHARWEELSLKQKIVAIGAGFIKNLPLALLPEYQASRIPEVREAANKQLEECLEQYTIEDLPDFLTDKDPTVREIARKLMEKAYSA